MFAPQGYEMGGDVHQASSMQSMLAYNEMTVSNSGSVLSDEQKRSLREKHGFCVECEGVPIKLYTIKKNKLNPVWKSKKSRAVAGECADGVCFVCYPNKNPHQKRRTRKLLLPDAQGGRNGPQHSNLRAQDQQSPIVALRRLSSPTPSSPSMTNKSWEDARHSTAFEEPRASNRPISHEGTSPHQPSRRSSNASEEGSRSTNDQRNSSHSRSSHPHATIPPPPMGLPPNSSQSTNSGYSSNDRRNSCHSKSSHPHTTTPLPPMSLPANSSHLTNSRHSAEIQNGAELSTTRPIIPANYDDFPMQQVQNCNPSRMTGAEERSVAESALTHSTRSSTSSIGGVRSQSVPSYDDDADIVIAQLDSVLSYLVGVPGSDDVFAEAITNIMREHKASEGVQSHCLRMIWDEAKDQDGKIHAIMRAGGPLDILRAMAGFPNSERVQEVGCGAIWALAINPNNRIVFIRQGACASIMQAISIFIGSEEVIRTGLSAIRTLSPEKEARPILQRLGGSPLIVQTMKTYPFLDCIQRDGCAFLSNLAVDIEKQEVLVVPTNELEVVVLAMQYHKIDPKVMKSACFTLKNFSFEENNCRRLRRVQNATELLTYASTFQACPECMNDACDILENMQFAKSVDESIEEQSYMSIISAVENQIRTSEAPYIILDFMKENKWSPKLTARGLQMFERIVYEDNGHRDRLFDDRLVPTIMDLARNQKDDESVCEEACSLIACLAEMENRRQELAEAGACDVIFFGLPFSRNKNLVKSALEALQALMSTNLKSCVHKVRGNQALVMKAIEHNPSSDTITMSGIGILSLLECS